MGNAFDPTGHNRTAALIPMIMCGSFGLRRNGTLRRDQRVWMGWYADESRHLCRQSQTGGFCL